MLSDYMCNYKNSLMMSDIKPVSRLWEFIFLLSYLLITHFETIVYLVLTPKIAMFSYLFCCMDSLDCITT